MPRAWTCSWQEPASDEQQPRQWCGCPVLDTTEPARAPRAHIAVTRLPDSPAAPTLLSRPSDSKTESQNSDSLQVSQLQGETHVTCPIPHIPSPTPQCGATASPRAGATLRGKRRDQAGSQGRAEAAAALGACKGQATQGLSTPTGVWGP